MITEKDVQDKNINLAMTTKETPAMDLTRMFVGYTPRSVFKQGYIRSVGMNDKKLLRFIGKNYDKNPKQIIPYLYDANRRGLDLPREITDKYKPINEGYLRDLNIISGVPSEKYVGTSMSVAGALTGIAGIDYLKDSLSRRSRVADRGFSAARLGPEISKKIILGDRWAKNYNKAFEMSLSEVAGRSHTPRMKFMERLMGSANTIPLTGAAMMPLLSRRVLRKLKGKDEDTNRYKAFDWVERHPKTTVAVAFTPHIGKTLVGGGFDMSRTIRDAVAQGAHPGRRAVGSLGRTGLNLARVGAAASNPLAYMGMRRHMTDAREEEDRLIIKKQKNIDKDTKK